MAKFNYTKMNVVLDDIQLQLLNNKDIQTKMDVIAGAILFLEKSINEAENLDSKMKIDYVNYFYKNLYTLSSKTNQPEFIEGCANLLVDTLNIKNGKKKKNPFFNTTIDILIITALMFLNVKLVDKAKFYFSKACEFGNNYLNDSKVNYHDSLCCATNWLGYLCLTEKNYGDALTHYEKTYELYNSVKDIKGFYYKEYNPYDIEIRITELKKILNV